MARVLSTSFLYLCTVSCSRQNPAARPADQAVRSEASPYPRKLHPTDGVLARRESHAQHRSRFRPALTVAVYGSGRMAFGDFSAHFATPGNGGSAPPDARPRSKPVNLSGLLPSRSLARPPRRLQHDRRLACRLETLSGLAPYERIRATIRAAKRRDQATRTANAPFGVERSARARSR